ncbi:MAG: fibrillarin-like rRNA/tRNA 2'-O-methyltransferase [Candidatus Micrarchaeaceae archaeon]
MEVKKLFSGVYLVDGKLATENLDRGSRVYGEVLVPNGSKEYRLWNPYRSKLAAAIINGLKNFKFAEDSKVLYLGAATGTTSSHVSDIVQNGRVFCVELSERNMRDLVKVCERRRNMFPILADANNTGNYSKNVGICDIIYQDVSARDQAAILNKNSTMLKRGGYAYFIIKSQSIDVSKKPEDVFDESLRDVQQNFEVVEKVKLEPFDELHMFVVLRKR